MLTLAGVGLTLPTAEVQNYIDARISLDRVRPFLSRSWPGPGNVFLAWPTGFRDWPPPLNLGHLHWPCIGASRWATGTFLVGNSHGEADAIRAAAFGSDGSKVNPVKLYMDSPDATTGQSVESVVIPSIYVMAVIPLIRVLSGSGTAGLNGMFMVIVADQRVFWWDVPTPDFGISEGAGVTWTTVIGNCATALGLSSIQTSTINAAYLAPSRAINLTNEPMAPVLDAIATNIGMRVVVGYDGLVTMTSFNTALGAYAQDQENNPGRDGRVLAGDFRFLDQL